MRHAISQDDLRRVVEKNWAGQKACREERMTRAEHHRNKIDHDLVHEAESQRLSSDLAARHVDDSVAGILLRGAESLLTLRTNVNGAVPACSQLAGGSWVTTKTCSPAAGLPFQPFVRSNSRRPMITQAISDIERA
jgi:hypothetical protein